MEIVKGVTVLSEHPDGPDESPPDRVEFGLLFLKESVAFC
jgi:hypothetical protein